MTQSFSPRRWLVTFLKSFFPSYRPPYSYLAFFMSKTNPFPPLTGRKMCEWRFVLPFCLLYESFFMRWGIYTRIPYVRRKNGGATRTCVAWEPPHPHWPTARPLPVLDRLGRFRGTGGRTLRWPWIPLVTRARLKSDCIWTATGWDRDSAGLTRSVRQLSAGSSSTVELYGSCRSKRLINGRRSKMCTR